MRMSHKAEAGNPQLAANSHESDSHPWLTLVSPGRLSIVGVHPSPFTKETCSVRITNLLKTKLAGVLIVALCASLVAPALAGAQQVDPTTASTRAS